MQTHTVIGVTAAALGALILFNGWNQNQKYRRIESGLVEQQRQAENLRRVNIDLKLEELRAKIGHVEVAQKTSTEITNRRIDEMLVEIKSFRKSLQNARKYARDMQKPMIDHINNSDLHPRSLKIEQHR